MIYQAYQAYADLSAPFLGAARVFSDIFTRPWPGPLSGMVSGRVTAAAEILARTGLTHKRPSFDIEEVRIGEESVKVTEEVALTTPFCTLLHFRKDIAANQPRILIVAPLSGHFATLLRGTVLTMLQDHDVYITDWHNVRDVSVLAGRFDLDNFIDHVIRFFDFLGPDSHVMAVCQPTVGTLAACAVMAEEGNPNLPSSITLMAGPMDTRINPTEVNLLATRKPLEWFEQSFIGVVPMRYKGGMRRVYPGFMQISAFMCMNLDRHTNSFFDLYKHIVNADLDQANPIRSFYEEYFALMDLPAEFYLQTVLTVFQEHRLAQGTFEYRGRTVNPAAIRKSALFTVEGERDDICAPGQTRAAHDICPGIPVARKRHHVQAGAGHYGVFNGKRWDQEIYPQVRDFIKASCSR
ncbi:MAG: polyhydroxyalkanoate depolymerase [Proteobacteria bacterium]|nr:polyhydroxyalkanoate depolymerase [Pseudomonadota bacterium]HQR04620.1 polyhydroxyalkanoate depolymerase [Rhodocyclaceae bacterium]